MDIEYVNIKEERRETEEAQVLSIPDASFLNSSAEDILSQVEDNLNQDGSPGYLRYEDIKMEEFNAETVRLVEKIALASAHSVPVTFAQPSPPLDRSTPKASPQKTPKSPKQKEKKSLLKKVATKRASTSKTTSANVKKRVLTTFEEHMLEIAAESKANIHHLQKETLDLQMNYLREKQEREYQLYSLKIQLLQIKKQALNS